LGILKVYGANNCEDTYEAVEKLKKMSVKFEFFDFCESSANLRAFLNMRDKEPIFDKVKEEGVIGIPCFVKPDGEITLDFDEALKR
jgi:glutaredoxin-related protein